MVRLDDGRPRRRAVRVAVAVALASCGGSTQPAGDAAPDMPPPPPWWQPKIGEAKNWDVQLGAPIDATAPRAMYDLDLWALVPAQTTIDYGDGDPVTVPAGALATTLAQLHARTPRTIVICHVETGMLELTRPDARKFPGYNANASAIPDNPTAPAAGSVIGWSVGAKSLRLLDIRDASRARWIAIMFKRFDLAKQIGCDGVEPSHNDVAQYPSGFAATALDSYSWYAEVAKQGHARMLSTGMKNGNSLAGQADMMADKFDWLMIERCGEYDDCASSRPFLNLMKAVFAIDYDHDIDGAAQGATTVCLHQQTGNVSDGIFKDVALTSGVRTQCVP